ncbi:MAG: glutamate--tRNA ligase [Solirubrobacterales bacterium]
MSTAGRDLRVRFAPSPTGELHIGGARTALYNWLAARHADGAFLLRIEDTDTERSTPENVAQIIEALEWLGLDWDGDVVFQSKSEAAHREAVGNLVERGLAYHDTSTADDVREWKEKEGADRGYRGTPSEDGEGAVRLRVDDEGEEVVHDLIRGEIRFPNRSLDDFVIARGDGSPLYNLAVAVDDAAMEVDLVIRGDDHLSNTQKQQKVLEALGAKVPDYAHAPLIHGTDGKKLSKREGAASVQGLRDEGYLPDAVVNYLALLGWGPEDDETVMDREELISRFRPEEIGKSSAVFDEKKLRWLNGRYMRAMAPQAYVEAVATFLDREPDQRLVEACAIAQEKAQTLGEVWPLIAFLFEPPIDDPKAWRKVMKGDALVDGDVVTQLSGFPDHHSGAVVDEKAPPDLSPRVDLDPGHRPRHPGDQEGKEGNPRLHEGVGQAVSQHGLYPRPAGGDRCIRDPLGRRVPFPGYLELFPKDGSGSCRFPTPPASLQILGNHRIRGRKREGTYSGHPNRRSR